MLAQTWTSSFCRWDQVVILKRFLCLLQVLVMQWWSFCAFSVLLLCLPSAASGRGLVAVDKAAWLTQSCVGVLTLRAHFIHSLVLLPSLPPSFSVAVPFASVYLSVTWHEVSRRCCDLLELSSLTSFYLGRNRVLLWDFFGHSMWAQGLLRCLLAELFWMLRVIHLF